MKILSNRMSTGGPTLEGTWVLPIRKYYSAIPIDQPEQTYTIHIFTRANTQCICTPKDRPNHMKSARESITTYYTHITMR